MTSKEANCTSVINGYNLCTSKLHLGVDASQMPLFEVFFPLGFKSKSRDKGALQMTLMHPQNGYILKKENWQRF
jgi:hypothetical protein